MRQHLSAAVAAVDAVVDSGSRPDGRPCDDGIDMSTKPRRALTHLTYANVVSTAALIVALGAGTAYAANTVFSTDIVDGDVQHVDLNASAVEGDRIVDGSVAHADLNAAAVAGDRVADGSLTLADVSGADVPTSLSVPKVRSGKCVTRTVTVPGPLP